MILGSTGSIGESTLTVVRQFPERFSIKALAAGRRVDRLIEQAKEFKVALVSVGAEGDVAKVAKALPGVEVFCGDEGLLEVVRASGVDLIVSALVGAVGLAPTYAGICAGVDIALANKETLVMAGEAMTKAAAASGAKLLPVDSEHSAIFQALHGHNDEDVKRIVLTASGGPFRGMSPEALEKVTLGEALKHPNWDMGPKITIDSATLMNKGLEVIEAGWLFNLPSEKITVAVHPQSIIHSMVEFVDGSIIAHMGVPDMRGPIGYALGYPMRLPLENMTLDLFKVGSLTFEEPDLVAFPALGLAYDAQRVGGTMPAVLSGANEVAVDAFLAEKIGFSRIAALVAETMDKHSVKKADTIEASLEADKWARATALDLLKKSRDL